MEARFIAINPFTNIPSLRFFVSHLVKEQKANVVITEMHVKSFNAYYTNQSSINFDNIAEYDSLQEYFADLGNNKLKKYKKAFNNILKCFRNRVDYIISNDFQVLFLVFIIQAFFKNSPKLIYTQFELIEIDKLGKLNLFLFNYVLKRSHRLDLAIFPEINRRDYYLNHSTIKEQNCMVIPNSCEMGDINAQKIDLNFGNKTVIGHIGNVGGKEHFFENIMQMIIDLKDDDSVHFLFVGYYDEEVQQRVDKLNLTNVTFIPSVPHHELVSYYNAIDIGLILYKGVSMNIELCAPNKLYEYWSYGIPVVAHNLKGLKPVFINDIQGKLIDFENRPLMKETLLSYLKEKREKSKLASFFQKELSINSHMEEFGRRLATLEE